jgi:tetratricopeptide (TPR) repeat protein
MSMPDALVLLARAEAALALRRWAEAERFARDALAAEPEAEQGHALLSSALTAQGRHDEGIATAEKGLAANPASEWLHRVRSLALFKAGRYSDALLAANEAVRLQPFNGSGYALQALALQALGRLGEAREAAERAVALSPDSSEFRAQLGDTWLKEDPARAERHYRESLTIDIEQPMVLNNLGLALRRQRRRAEAALAFRSALLLDPTLALPKWNILGISNPVVLAPGAALASIALFILALGLAYYSMTHRQHFAPAFGSMLACETMSLGMIGWARRIGSRRLERLDPQLHAIRRNLEADLRARRLEPLLDPVWLRRVSVALVAFGAAIFLGSLTGEILIVRKYLAYPKAPRRVTLEASRSGDWVELDGVVLDCASRLEINGNTYFGGKSPGGRELVAFYDETLTCNQAGRKLVGVVSDLSPKLASTLARHGFATPRGQPAEICAWCGPRNALIGTLVLPVFVAIGALLAWSGVRNLRQRPSAYSGTTHS